MTPADVEERLVAAHDCLRGLPLGDLRYLLGPKASWPEYHHRGDGDYHDEDKPTVIKPSAEQITKADEAREWLSLLDERTRRIVDARTARVRWRDLEIRLHLGRHQLRRIYFAGLLTIANLLTDAPNAPIIRPNTSRLDKCAAGPKRVAAVLRSPSD